MRMRGSKTGCFSLPIQVSSSFCFDIDYLRYFLFMPESKITERLILLSRFIRAYGMDRFRP
jgi:hypothetical protein